MNNSKLLKFHFSALFLTANHGFYVPLIRKIFVYVDYIMLFRDVVRTLQNILNGDFLRKYIMDFSRELFSGKSSIIDVWKGPKCAPVLTGSRNSTAAQFRPWNCCGWVFWIFFFSCCNQYLDGTIFFCYLEHI